MLAVTFAVRAQADDVTSDNLGRSTDTFYYSDRNPALGEMTATAWGTKFDSDGDDDNTADKHRSQGLAVKKQSVRRIALRSRLQRFINDADGARWVTVISSDLMNSGNTAQSVRAASPVVPFKCGLRTPGRYRAVSSGANRYYNHVLEHFEEISGEWRASSPACPIVILPAS